MNFLPQKFSIESKVPFNGAHQELPTDTETEEHLHSNREGRRTYIVAGRDGYPAQETKWPLQEPLDLHEYIGPPWLENGPTR